jgi:hypothetical protein
MKIKTTYGPKGKVNHKKLVKQINNYLNNKPPKNEKS